MEKEKIIRMKEFVEIHDKNTDRVCIVNVSSISFFTLSEDSLSTVIKLISGDSLFTDIPLNEMLDYMSED